MAAGFFPWVDHPRLPSRTSVVPNGGRTEAFLIRLPADQIALYGDQRVASASATAPQEDGPKGMDLLAEHFKVRDAGGDVVGVAGRHVVNTPQGPVTTWVVALPSRGSIWLEGSADPDRVRRSLASSGYVPGSDYRGEIRWSLQDVEDPSRSGAVLSGSGEFRGLAGHYLEEWQISGVDGDGTLQGTIRLETVTRGDNS